MAEFQKVAKESHRMCGAYKTCNGCPMKAVDVNGSCFKWMIINPEEAEDIIMQWSSEHPIVTNRMKFKEIFGDNVVWESNGTMEAWFNAEYKRE